MVDVREWSRADTVPFLRVPTADDDKYSRGVVAVRTGSNAYPGAAVLGVEAAWRTGAGFVRFVGEGRAADAVIARRPETVAAADIGSTRVDAWVIGSGTSAAHRSWDEDRALHDILAGTAPVAVDAGALDLAPNATAPLVVTPHAGEFARLRARLGLNAGSSGDRAADAAEVAALLSATVLLKGATTLIAAPDGSVTSVTGAPGWLATAGAGDVLAGMLGALIATNADAPLDEVAAAAAWLHGYAAALASGAADGPGHPIVALDVAETIPAAIEDLLS
ncbi:ADP/ATP-dependent (S)-NAD(P)H-hydrate dehydratase [Microbacterium sp.]|uniref:ADP-dependent NAD(P)H-hydrate dehydratase n=1 Tax=Microbacterium sp. TaxID=51671 RepID=UPI002D0FE987|nr:ADP/ATP-dependent (S)-NAD(P)H-hydrate dehydratase [Microbacterium sp.]HWK77302.1 ADP/ATP-dependent (S)-NAD(P)H-hydrate dehydratase [Microbacterium sp.]